MSPAKPENLARLHTPQAIALRLQADTDHSYLRDFIFGAIDGTVTTFAVVAGVAGAGLPTGVAIVLGVANMLADGFSMAASNYLSTKAGREQVEHARRIESRHIDEVPQGEREEIRQIFAAKGFDGDLLERVVEIITQDRQRWIDTMIAEELKLPLETPRPLRAAISTFVAFIVAGTVPLLPLLASDSLPPRTTFAISALATAATFFVIGVAKSLVVRRGWLASGLETLAVGGFAAVTAYGVGMFLHNLIGG